MAKPNLVDFPEYLTFDDVLLKPGASSVLPAEVATATRLTRTIELSIPNFASQKIGDTAHHLEVKRHHRNWSPEALYWSLRLLSLSITNVKAALRILNGVPATDVNFQWPTDKEVFQEPWKRSVQIGITSMSRSAIYVRPEFIDPISKAEILKRYKAGQDAGVKRITFSGEPNADSEAAAN